MSKIREEVQGVLKTETERHFILHALDRVENEPPEYVPGYLEPRRTLQQKAEMELRDTAPTQQKKKRKPSEYNIFIGECMKNGNDMKTCADMYKESKNAEPTPKSASDEVIETPPDGDFGIDEHQGWMELITEDFCGSCDRVKDALQPLIDDGVIVVREAMEDEVIESVPAVKIDGKYWSIDGMDGGYVLSTEGEDDITITMEDVEDDIDE